MTKKLPPMDQAIKAAGGLTALARSLGETKQTVHNWRKRGEPPANKTLAVETVTGVSRRVLRSDWAAYWPVTPSNQQAA